jgi:hypothetical protein
MDFVKFGQVKSLGIARCAIHAAASIVVLRATLSEALPITNVPAMHTRGMNGPLS